MLVEAINPDPERLPTLHVWQTDDDRGMTYVAGTFPNVPDFRCDSWCYESPLDFVGARAIENGGIELQHRAQDHPHVLIVTTVTARPGVVEFAARPRLEIDAPHAMPEQVLTPNLCWQLGKAPAFASRPDPYPEFVKRCFIFTDEGLTFLHQTERKRIPVRPPDHEYNNPPWVQMYLPVWEPLRQAGDTSWADYSPDRYLYPVIGTVSRDARHLTAIACNVPTDLCQAWHDCMHNNPAWEEEDGGKVWRLRIYAMDNDPQELLRKMGEDFPQSPKLKERRIP